MTETATATVPVTRFDRSVLIAMAHDALVARTLLNGCRVCETGYPCPECVIDVQRQREYQKVLEALGGG